MEDQIKPNEIYIYRIYNALVEEVWQAWVDPQQVKKWWGPRGFTITNHSKDVQTGGHWNYTMHGPDGVDYPNKTKYHEVIKNSLMIYDHGANDDQPALFKVTVRFSEVNGQTHMRMIMALPTEEAAIQTKKFIKQAGGNTTWDRLGEYLEYQSSKKDIFIISQSFHASMDLMFQMWTEPKHLTKWVAPAASKMEYLRADVRPNGSSFYSMNGMGDTKMYGQVHYLEINKPNQIIYTQSFCDQNEKIARHPMAATWPEVMKTTVTLNKEGVDKTLVTVQWEIYGSSTLEEQQTFNQAKAGMSQGWGGSFDNLEKYLGEVH